MSTAPEDEGVFRVDPPDHRERCSRCGRLYEGRDKQIAREIGGQDRSFHEGCYELWRRERARCK